MYNVDENRIHSKKSLLWWSFLKHPDRFSTYFLNMAWHIPNIVNCVIHFIYSSEFYKYCGFIRWISISVVSWIQGNNEFKCSRNYKFAKYMQIFEKSRIQISTKVSNFFTYSDITIIDETCIFIPMFLFSHVCNDICSRDNRTLFLTPHKWFG